MERVENYGGKLNMVCGENCRGKWTQNTPRITVKTVQSKSRITEETGHRLSPELRRILILDSRRLVKNYFPRKEQVQMRLFLKAIGYLSMNLFLVLFR